MDFSCFMDYNLCGLRVKVTITAGLSVPLAGKCLQLIKPAGANDRNCHGKGCFDDNHKCSI